jgi:hypothetical protein
MEGVDGINLIHIRAEYKVLANSNKLPDISERLSAYNEGSDIIASSGMRITE